MGESICQELEKGENQVFFCFYSTFSGVFILLFRSVDSLAGYRNLYRELSFLRVLETLLHSLSISTAAAEKLEANLQLVCCVGPSHKLLVSCGFSWCCFEISQRCWSFFLSILEAIKSSVFSSVFRFSLFPYHTFSVLFSPAITIIQTLNFSPQPWNFFLFPHSYFSISFPSTFWAVSLTLSFSLSFEFCLIFLFSKCFIFCYLNFICTLAHGTWCLFCFLWGTPMPHPGGPWGWGSWGMHLTWSVVLPGPQGLGVRSFSVPVFIHSAHQLVMFSFPVYVIHHTVHTHTHTHTHTQPVLTRPPPLCPVLVSTDPVLSCTLPRWCPRALCVGQSPRRVPQEAASPFLARQHSGDSPALGGSQSFVAFTLTPGSLCLGHCLPSS